MDEACINGNVELVKQLIKEGVDPTQADEVSTIKSHDFSVVYYYKCLCLLEKL